MIYVETISEYTMYLQVDAIIGRSIIHEALGEFTLARDDIYQFVNNVLPDNDSDIDYLKLSLQTATLYAICRLPLLERVSGLHAESLASFKRCISGDNVLKSRISSQTKSALTFAASFLLLKKANLNSSEENAVSDIDDAFSLLQATQQHICGSNISMAFSPKPLEHLTQSIVRKLPFTIASPESITAFATPGRIAILISAISKRRGKSLSNNVELLEWGVNFEVQLNLELLWSLACAYAAEDDVERALSLFNQAHHNLILRNEESNDGELQESEFSDLVHWLTVGPHPIPCPWLPTVRAANLCLDRLCDPVRALKILYANMKDLYPNIIDVFDELVHAPLKSSSTSFDPLHELSFHLSQSQEVPSDNSTVTTPCRQALVASYLDRLGEIDSGIIDILFEAGRSLAIAGRSISERSSVRRANRQAALTVFQLLLAHYKNVMHSLSFCPEKLLVEYAVLLAESGEIDEATAIAKESIKNYKESSRLTHLLAILSSNAGGDPELYGAATELCEFSFSTKSFMNTGLSLALLKWSVGDLVAALLVIEKLVSAFRENIENGSETKTCDDVSKKLLVDFYILEWDRSPQALRLSVEILVTASSLYRRSDMIAKARECTDMALRLL